MHNIMFMQMLHRLCQLNSNTDKRNHTIDRLFTTNKSRINFNCKNNNNSLNKKDENLQENSPDISMSHKLQATDTAQQYIMGQNKPVTITKHNEKKHTTTCKYKKTPHDYIPTITKIWISQTNTVSMNSNKNTIDNSHENK